jgi:hypothetical protein
MAGTVMRVPPTQESLRPQPAERALRPRRRSNKLAASIYCEVDGLPVELEPLELSTAGLFVETPTPLPVDSEVDVFVRIGPVRFEASGHVVQTVSCEQAKTTRRKPGYGLLFTNIDEAARAQLRRGIEMLVVQRSDAQRAVAATPATTGSRPAKPQPSAPAAPHIDPREQELLDRLRTELRALDSKTPWGILGVSQGADLAEAKQAFFDASKRYHPHLFARYAAAEIKPLVTQLFIAHKRAYDTMLKSSKAQRNSLVEPVGHGRISSRQPGSGNK